MPLRKKSFGCQCSHSWTSCITSTLLRNLFPSRCSFRGPKKWQSEGARSGRYGGCGRTFHFSFWMVSMVRVATCGRAFSWINDTVCALFLLFLMTVFTDCFHTTITAVQYSRQLAVSYSPVLSNEHIDAVTVLACYGSPRPALIRFILHRFPSYFNPLTTVYFRSIIYHSGPMDPNRIIWYTTLAKCLQCFISLLCCLLAIKVLVVTHLEFQLLFLYLKFLLRNCTMWHVHAEYYITADIIGVLR